MSSESSQANATGKTGVLRRGLKTWPGKTAGAVFSLLLGWAVSYFAPGLWADLTGALGKEPVSVQVVITPDRIESAKDTPREYLVPHSISEVGPPPSGAEPTGRFEWSRSMGGVDAWESYVELIIRGQSPDPVVLLDLDVNIVSRGAPLMDTLLSYDGLGAGIDVRKIWVDLDHDRPRIFRFDEDLNEVETFPLRVSNTEVEVIDLAVGTSSCDCRWTAKLHYEADGERGSVDIDNGGEPFRTVAPANGSRRYYWWRGHWEMGGRLHLDPVSRCTPSFGDATEPSSACLQRLRDV